MTPPRSLSCIFLLCTFPSTKTTRISRRLPFLSPTLAPAREPTHQHIATVSAAPCLGRHEMTGAETPAASLLKPPSARLPSAWALGRHLTPNAGRIAPRDGVERRPDERRRAPLPAAGVQTMAQAPPGRTAASPFPAARAAATARASPGRGPAPEIPLWVTSVGTWCGSTDKATLSAGLRYLYGHGKTLPVGSASFHASGALGCCVKWASGTEEGKGGFPA